MDYVYKYIYKKYIMSDCVKEPSVKEFIKMSKKNCSIKSKQYKFCLKLKNDILKSACKDRSRRQSVYNTIWFDDAERYLEKIKKCNFTSYKFVISEDTYYPGYDDPNDELHEYDILVFVMKDEL